MLHTLALVTVMSALTRQPLAGSDVKIKTYQGSFNDGATYLIQVPSNWNGTFVLYSHGYVTPGSNNPAFDASNSVTQTYLLGAGYALGGSSYATTGWAIQQALPDQVATVQTFESLVGMPRRTIAWGDSLGGLVTAGLVQQYPKMFTAALPMCGVVAGGVGLWNVALDGAFAFNSLVAGGALQVVNITNPSQNFSNAEVALSNAQNTAAGKARIALGAALTDLPGWYDSSLPPPPPTNYEAQEKNQYLWFSRVDFVFAFYLRAELEARAGGNPSFNNGVDFKQQFDASVDKAEVEALYAKAHLNLATDLAALNAATRITANAGALEYLTQNIILDGQLGIPVLTMHTEGDGLVGNQNESAYELAAQSAGDAQDLRRLFIHRAGHCAFTPAEEVTSLHALVRRLDLGHWGDLSPAILNTQAKMLGKTLNLAPPAYDAYTPAPFLRVYNGKP
jgi:pimeloyl-ACP methyl ester carboxylesterase